MLFVIIFVDAAQDRKDWFVFPTALLKFMKYTQEGTMPVNLDRTNLDPNGETFQVTRC